jgi:hypothetical protein
MDNDLSKLEVSTGQLPEENKDKKEESLDESQKRIKEIFKKRQKQK